MDELADDLSPTQEMSKIGVNLFGEREVKGKYFRCSHCHFKCVSHYQYFKHCEDNHRHWCLATINATDDDLNAHKCRKSFVTQNQLADHRRRCHPLLATTVAIVNQSKIITRSAKNLTKSGSKWLSMLPFPSRTDKTLVANTPPPIASNPLSAKVGRDQSGGKRRPNGDQTNDTLLNVETQPIQKKMKKNKPKKIMKNEKSGQELDGNGSTVVEDNSYLKSFKEFISKTNCKQCGQVFDSYGGLKQHNRLYHLK